MKGDSMNVLASTEGKGVDERAADRHEERAGRGED